MDDKSDVRFEVKQRYAAIAGSDKGCCCSGCDCSCEADALAHAEAIGYSKEDLASIPADAVMGLGCGNPAALAGLNEGEVVLDLGSGGGIDVLLVAGRVGTKGKAIGVDMTPEMIERARKNAEAGGYTNVEFRLGEIEHLPAADSSVDVIISNCVINLSPDKPVVFREAFRILRPGGRVLVSDIVSEGPVPDTLRQDADAWAACIAGAMERREYIKVIRQAGFRDVSVVGEHQYRDIGIGNGERLIMTSIQIRAIK